eukprot:175380_1
MTYYLVFIILASIGFGLCGVWTMHYTGMVAYQFEHVQMRYNISLVIVSGIAAVVLVCLGFFYVGRKVSISEHSYKTKQSLWKISFRTPHKHDLIHCAIGGMVIALGVSTMHYVGMAAVIIHATAQWQIGIVALSVCIAIIVSFVGLLLLLFTEGLYGRLFSCLVIGVAVCSMHYVGMFGVKYYVNAQTIFVSNTNGFTFTAQLTSTISGCIVSFILILHHSIKLHQYRHTNFYKKRYGAIIIIANIFCLLYILFASLSVFMPDGYIAWRTINAFLLLFSFYGLLASILLRYILSWYSINLLAAKESLTWQTFLNSHISEIESPFFLQNIIKYGNITWLACRVYAVFVVLLLMDFVNDMTIAKNKFIFPLIVLLCTLSIILFLYKNTPSSFNDLLYIFGEMKLIAVIILVMLVASVCAHFIISEQTSFAIFYTFLTMIGLTIIAILPIEIVLHKQTENSSKTHGNTLAGCLGDMDSLTLFIKHLNKECAMECLLFIIEQMQFKKHFGTLLMRTQRVSTAGSRQLQTQTNATFVRLNSDTKTSSENGDLGFTFPDDMPLSVAVHHAKNSKDSTSDLEQKVQLCKEAAYKLYQKYMIPYSEFEVNISYVIREPLDDLLRDYDEWMNNKIDEYDLVHVFDGVSAELYELLEGPFIRFCRK